MLHDIGHFINTLEHDQHGYYLLSHHVLIGLRPKEQEIVANIVRYHRKEAPSLLDENFKQLSQKDRLTVTRLCALLRLADALDTSHTARVHGVQLESHEGFCKLQLVGDGDFMLEKWTIEKRKTLFQNTFGVKLEIV